MRFGKAVYGYSAERFSLLVSEDLARNLEKTIDVIENVQKAIENGIRVITSHNITRCSSS